MEIKRDHMIHLGYAKYWRSDQVVGLIPVEEGRGPGQRTQVFVATSHEPIMASRSESSILRDMASLPDEARAAEVGSIAEDLVEALRGITPVLKRVLKHEEGFDVDYWLRRLRRVVDPADSEASQEELFG